MINLMSSKMASNQEFETESSINSDEDIKLITVQSFNAHFHYEIEFHGTSTTTLVNNANPPIPSPNYKFMGLTYTTEEFANESQSKVNCSFPISETKQFICPIPKRLRQKKRKQVSCSLSPRNLFNFKDNQFKEADPNLQINLLNISDLPKIIRQNKHFSTNTQYSTNPFSPKKGQKYFPASNREVKMPSSILKSPQSDKQLDSPKNLLSVSHQILRIPNKKVSFELTKEQKRKLKQKPTNPISRFAKQQTKFLKN